MMTCVVVCERVGFPRSYTLRTKNENESRYRTLDYINYLRGEVILS